MGRFGDLLNAGEFVDGTVCTDCLFGVEYGQWPTGDADWTATRAREANAAVSKYQIVLGHLHTGPFASTGCYHSGRECEEDCDCARDTFSRVDCSVCGSGLAGERHDVVMIAYTDLKAGP